MKDVFKSNRLLIAGLLIPFALFLVTFCDVIFAKAGVTMASLYNGFNGGFWDRLNIRKVAYFNPPYRQYTDYLNDYGGSLFQSEPAALYTRNTLLHGDSPFWNPYAACGSYGVQTLADLKLSAQTIAIALLGGSQNAFHIVFLGMALIGSIALFFVLTSVFGCSAFAATVGGAVFLLNGWVQTNLFLNVQQAYFFAPIILLAAGAFAAKPNRVRYVLLVLANALLLSDTFIPTTLFVLLTANAIGAVCCIKGDWRDTLKALVLQASAIAVAACLLAVVYLPVIESFLSSADVDKYSARSTFCGGNIYSVLSLFTPTHFWEEYRAWNVNSPDMTLLNKINHPMESFHMGIMIWLLSGAAAIKAVKRPVVLVAVVTLIVALGRVFQIPPITEIVGAVPLIKSIGNNYWYCLVSLASVVLAAFGVDEAASRDRKTLLGTGGAALIFVGAMVLLLLIYGVRASHAAPDVNIIKMYLAKDVTILLVGLTLLGAIKFTAPTTANWLRMGIVGLAVIELVSYTIHYRYVRTEVFRNPPYPVNYMQANIADKRIATFGNFFLPPDYGSAFQLPQIESLEMNGLHDYTEFFVKNFLPTQDVKWGPYPYPTLQMVRPGTWFNKVALDALGVKYIVVANALIPQFEELMRRHCDQLVQRKFVHVLENHDAFPRVFAVHRLVEGDAPWSDGAALRTSAFSHDKRLLGEANNLRIARAPTEAAAPADVGKFLCYRNGRVSMDISTRSPGILVLMDSFHACWSATDNGKPVYIGKINDCFRGVALDSGHHVVEMNFEPKSYRAGVGISIVTLLSLLFIAFGNKSRRELTKSKLVQPSEAERSCANV